MLLTLISFIVATLLVSYPFTIELSVVANWMIFAGTVLLVSQTLIQILSLSPLQKLEERLVPGLIELFRRKKSINLSRSLIYLFTLISYVFGIALISFDFPYKIWLLSVWLIGLGVTLDFIRDEINQVMVFLNPLHAVKELQDRALSAVQNENDEELRHDLDALAEVSVRSLETKQFSLATEAINSFSPIMELLFNSVKSISHPTKGSTAANDQVTYTVFYLLERLDLIYQKALKSHSEIICNLLIKVLGKITIYAAKCDLSLVSYPALRLSSFALKAQAEGMDRAATMATVILLEISKVIVNEVNLNGTELEPPFESIIAGLNAIAKATFKRDKSIQIKLLTEPLRELKALFDSEKVATHLDTPSLLRQIDDLLAEYEALEQVMNTIPPISGFSDQSKEASEL